MSDCLFCKIVAGQIPAKIAFEDADVMVIHDIYPKAKVHLLMVPKKHLDSLAAAGADDAALLGKMMLLIPRVAAEQGLAAGFKTLINTGKAGGQEFFHLHIHILGEPQAAA